MHLQTLTAPDVMLKKSELLNVIILLYKNNQFAGFLNSFDIEICGKPMWKYVECATSAYPTKTTLCTHSTNIYSLIRPMLTNSKFTLVLFSDTPLITKQTVEEIAEYVMQNNITCHKLVRGFVFDTEFVKNAQSLANDDILYFGDEDFTTVFDLKQLEFVSSIMKTRILEHHQRNGVLIEDNLTTFIDFDVKIECGVVVEPLCIVKGKTQIGKNTKILAGSYLENAKIGNNCIIQKSFIKNAVILPCTQTKPFEIIER